MSHVSETMIGCEVFFSSWIIRGIWAIYIIDFTRFSFVLQVFCSIFVFDDRVEYKCWRLRNEFFHEDWEDQSSYFIKFTDVSIIFWRNQWPLQRHKLASYKNAVFCNLCLGEDHLGSEASGNFRRTDVIDRAAHQMHFLFWNILYPQYNS